MDEESRKINKDDENNTLKIFTHEIQTIFKAFDVTL